MCVTSDSLGRELHLFLSFCKSLNYWKIWMSSYLYINLPDNNTYKFHSMVFQTLVFTGCLFISPWFRVVPSLNIELANVKLCGRRYASINMLCISIIPPLMQFSTLSPSYFSPLRLYLCFFQKETPPPLLFA